MVTSTQTLRIVAETEFAGAAADVIAAVVQHKPGAVLGLPTGNTPLPVYRELIIRHQCGKLDLSRVQVVQLDEYLGVTPQEPTSFAAWLRTHLLDACAIGPERVHLLPAGGSGAALDQACRDFERKLSARGGCDLQMLGLGLNGHVAFNDPGAERDSRTRVVTLAPETRAGNAVYWDGREVPPQAVTQGIATLLEARQVLLLVNGARKADILQRTLEGPVGSAVPASFLREAAQLQVVCDREAGSRLQFPS